MSASTLDRYLSTLSFVQAKASTRSRSCSTGRSRSRRRRGAARILHHRLDPLTQSGDFLGTFLFGTSDSRATRKVQALYGEVNVPLLAGLEAQLAGRLDHYSDFGSAFSPKLAVRWQAQPRLLLRASAGPRLPAADPVPAQQAERREHRRGPRSDPLPGHAGVRGLLRPITPLRCRQPGPQGGELVPVQSRARVRAHRQAVAQHRCLANRHARQDRLRRQLLHRQRESIPGPRDSRTGQCGRHRARSARVRCSKSATPTSIWRSRRCRASTSSCA